MNYTIQYFIDKFTAIPSNKWCTSQYSRLVEHNPQYCALGHCGHRPGKFTKESGKLTALFLRKGY